MARREDKYSRYIRERVRLAREEAGLSQEDLARALEKNRVAISDLERGRVGVDASDLFIIAHTLKKPISYFYPPAGEPRAGELPPIIQEIVLEVADLPETQQLMALEYIRQQRQFYEKANKRARDAYITQARFESEDD